MRALLLLAVLLLPFSHASADGSTVYRYKAPAFFGMGMEAGPDKMAAQLLKIGYVRETWRLEAPYTRQIYRLADKQAVIPRVELLVCNHPHAIAAVILGGGEQKAFYRMMRERFQLGIPEWEGGGDVQKGRFVRDFAGNIRVHLHMAGDVPELTLEAPDVMKTCRTALARDADTLKKASDAVRKAREQERQKQF